MIQARSIGNRAGEILRRPPTGGRVLASFARVCDLLTDDGDIIALAWGGVINGPLNILLDNQPGAALPAGTRFVVSETRIRLAVEPPVEIELAGAEPWDARMDWGALARGRERIAANAGIVVGQFGKLPGLPLGNLANCPTSGAPDRSGGRAQPAHLPAAACAIRDLHSAYACGDLPALGAAASRLCGLGPGLTPSGDDWLAGWLIGLRLNRAQNVDAIGEAILAAARERTTLLSRAFLACAAAGEVDENWQELLSALSCGPETRVAVATGPILAHGATSGADMLAGFLDGLDASGEEFRHILVSKEATL